MSLLLLPFSFLTSTAVFTAVAAAAVAAAAASDPSSPLAESEVWSESSIRLATLVLQASESWRERQGGEMRDVLVTRVRIMCGYLFGDFAWLYCALILDIKAACHAQDSNISVFNQKGSLQHSWLAFLAKYFCPKPEQPMHLGSGFGCTLNLSNNNITYQ